VSASLIKAKAAAEPKIQAIIADLMVYIIEKDSKRFFIYNTKTQGVTTNTV